MNWPICWRESIVGATIWPSRTSSEDPSGGKRIVASPDGRTLVYEDGTPHVGTGAEGQVYAVDADRNRKLVADVEARQISARGGYLVCEDRGDRVGIGGKAVLYLEGRISL